MKTTTENSGKKRPRVISADVQVDYSTGEKRKEKKSIVFKRESITIWDDLMTLPEELTEEVSRRFERMVRKTKGQQLTIEKVSVVDFYHDFGIVNYEPVGGWKQI